MWILGGFLAGSYSRRMLESLDTNAIGGDNRA